jgi:hypothetical protein
VKTCLICGEFTNETYCPEHKRQINEMTNRIATRAQTGREMLRKRILYGKELAYVGKAES